MAGWFFFWFFVFLLFTINTPFPFSQCLPRLHYEDIKLVYPTVPGSAISF